MIAPVSELDSRSYLSLPEYISANQDDFGFEPTGRALPSSQTLPGSSDRIELLRQRMERGEPMFVEGDAIPSVCEAYLDRWGETVDRGTSLCGATFSKCDNYRYRLWRYWDEDPNKMVACFIGLNPSTADEQQLDPTLRRLKSFAMQWGCRGFEMLNLFAYRATDPKDMMRQEDPIGCGNDRAIITTAERCSFVVCCWGVGGSHKLRSARVLWALKNRLGKRRLHCFGITKKYRSSLDPTREVGQPKHPLYLPGKSVTIELPFHEVDADDAPAMGSKYGR